MAKFSLLWTLLVLMGVSLYLVPGVQGDHCNNDHFQKCFKFRNELLNISSGYFLLKELSEDLMDDYCSIFTRVTKSCLENLSAHCNDETAGRLDGFIEATSFLCEEGFEEFLALKPCLERANTHRQLLICAEQYSIEVENIGRLDKDADLRYCQATEELIDCEADALEHTCNVTEAGDWTRTYNTKFYQGYLRALDCISTTTTQPPDTLPPWVIAVSVIGGILVLTLVITASVCLIRRSNNQTEQQKHPDRHSNPQPSVTVIVDNRHMNHPRKQYGRYPSNESHTSHSRRPHSQKSSSSHHKRLPRSNSESHSEPAPSKHENPYTHLNFSKEDVRYHRDPTSHVSAMPMDHMVGMAFHTNPPPLAMPAGVPSGAVHGVINTGFDQPPPYPSAENVEDDYLHPVESTVGGKSNVYEELPADIK